MTAVNGMAAPPLTINLNGRLMDFAVPKVMGIVNVTPDSFYDGSRTLDRELVAERVRDMVSAGVDIIDVGGCSTRPGGEQPGEDEEMRRLAIALDTIGEIAPGIPVSVDTWRSGVARRCVEGWGVEIINDVSGGTLDPGMWETVADLRAAYVLMHMRGTPETMQGMTAYGDVTAEVLEELARSIYRLRLIGVCDIIVDPGFGFAKTTEQNFRLLDDLGVFRETGCPVLAGMSRKSMIWRTLGASPGDSLAGTVAVNTIALERGADIIRVHDVREGVAAVRITQALKQSRNT